MVRVQPPLTDAATATTKPIAAADNFTFTIG
jgi:hypothetical protein